MGILALPVRAVLPQAVLDVYQHRRWALEAQISDLTLRRVLRGARVRPSTLSRVLRAADALGLAHLVPEGRP